MKNVILNLVLLGLLILGLIQEAGGQRKYRGTRPVPPLLHRPEAPSPLHVWIGGEWVWQTKNYVWHQGYWAIPPAGKIWKEGKWKSTRYGWSWVPGRWVRKHRLTP
jgi:hypothetical protein